MPTKSAKWDWELITLLLSVYDGGSWAEGLSTRDRPESQVDRGIDALVTRTSDGLTLAIEHTRIEPFVGERDDYYKCFKELQEQLWADGSLRVPGFALYLDMPVRALPRGPKRQRQQTIDDVAAWLRTEHPSFPSTKSQRRCPCRHQPSGELTVQVAKVPLSGPARSLPVIVQRYGETRLDESVEKALKGKLPKLVEARAGRRMLLLERDQGWLVPADILAAVDRRRHAFPELAEVHEIWIADTATFRRARFLGLLQPLRS